MTVVNLATARAAYEATEAAEHAAWATYQTHKGACGECRLHEPCATHDMLFGTWRAAYDQIERAMQTWLAQATETEALP